MLKTDAALQLLHFSCTGICTPEVLSSRSYYLEDQALIQDGIEQFMHDWGTISRQADATPPTALLALLAA